MSSEETSVKEAEEVVTFKKRSRRGNLRTVSAENRPDTSGGDASQKEKGIPADEENDDDDSVDWSTLDGYRELKRAKKRVHNGINVLDLMNEANKKVVESKSEKREGGLKDAKTLASELDLGNTFSLETNRRDEDAELMKYVEEELAKRRPQATNATGEVNSNAGVKSLSSDDLLIRVIPEHLLKISSEAKAKNEEMLSSQMLSGIPEVDLGIEERIRNIEKTEAARTKLIQERLRQLDKSRGGDQDKDISLVPSNLASCFTRNNIVQQAANASNHRFNLNTAPGDNTEMMEHFRRKEDSKGGGGGGYKQPLRQSYDIEPVVVLGAEPQKVRLPKPIDKDKRAPGKDKPQDDYIFEKFRKHLKKH